MQQQRQKEQQEQQRLGKSNKSWKYNENQKVKHRYKERVREID